MIYNFSLIDFPKKPKYNFSLIDFPKKPKYNFDFEYL